MRIVRVALLNFTAAFVAIAAAQAADVSVKARPTEYVKVCSLYGEGFYYIPGTETCIKIGGFVRLQAEYNSGGVGIVAGATGNAGMGRFTRDLTNDINYLGRAVVSFDVRTQTEYGTLRSYMRVGWQVPTPGATGAGTTALGYWDRAFIQFAGFTVGRAQSFFDVFTNTGKFTYSFTRMNGDTDITGATVWAYTVQFGNGFSISASLEDPVFRAQPVVDVTCPDFFGRGSNALQDNAFNSNGAPCAQPAQFGFRVPDLVLNARLDQDWGYAGVSVVAHDASGGYYNTPNSVNNGHPADKYGWAAGLGGQVNLPGGDNAGIMVVVSEGATGYATNAGHWQLYKGSTSVGHAWVTDGIFGTGSDVELTRAWSVNAGYQHFWGSAGTFGGKWRTSIYGGYAAIEYNDRAKFLINDRLPVGSPCKPGVAAATITGFTPLAGNSCSPDASWWQVGSRTQFNPHPLLDVGLDVFYTRLNSAYKGPTNLAANGSRPACTNNAPAGLACALDDQSVLSAIMRWQRNFYP